MTHSTWAQNVPWAPKRSPSCSFWPFPRGRLHTSPKHSRPPPASASACRILPPGVHFRDLNGSVNGVKRLSKEHAKSILVHFHEFSNSFGVKSFGRRCDAVLLGGLLIFQGHLGRLHLDGRRPQPISHQKDGVRPLAQLCALDVDLEEAAQASPKAIKSL